MLRRFILPLLAVALFATEATQAQTAPTKETRQAYRQVRKAERVLSKREQQVAAARAQAAAAEARAQAVAPAGPTAWSGWSNDPLPFTPEAAAPHRATGANVSVAPGMPVNQIGHGVSTDYNGRPLARANAGTTLNPNR